MRLQVTRRKGRGAFASVFLWLYLFSEADSAKVMGDDVCLTDGEGGFLWVHHRLTLSPLELRTSFGFMSNMSSGRISPLLDGNCLDSFIASALSSSLLQYSISCT